MVGYGFPYNTLDNNRNPTSGLIFSVTQDFAGVGGDVRFIKTIIDTRMYHEVLPDVIGLFRFQTGHAAGWGGSELRMLDHFQGGPNLVRGFAPAGFGPRDLTSGTNNDALGGSLYWASTVEFQTPLFFAPKDFGMRFAVFADAGQLLNYRGPTSWDVTGEQMTTCIGGTPGQNCNDTMVRSSAGVGLIWDSPFGPLRFDLAYALTKQPYDRLHLFRFGAEPYRAFVTVARALFPTALRPSSLFGAEGVAPGATVHPTARVENGVSIDPGVVVGAGAEIGAGTVIAANAVIGPGVRIGRNCAIGAGASIMHALIGDRVIIHPGCPIGQDGFGFLPDKAGPIKIPQTRRVIIQDSVEIGANTTIDRGASRDTVIGEGTKIDNLAQIAHNCWIERHCFILSQPCISATVEIGDYAMLR